MDICLLSMGALLLVCGLSVTTSFASTSLAHDSTSVRLRALDPIPFTVSMVACVTSLALFWLAPVANSVCCAISASLFLLGLGFRVQVEVAPESSSVRRTFFGFISWSSTRLTSIYASYEACPFSGDTWLSIGGDELQISWWGVSAKGVEERAMKFNAAVHAVRGSC